MYWSKYKPLYLAQTNSFELTWILKFWITKIEFDCRIWSNLNFLNFILWVDSIRPYSFLIRPFQVQIGLTRTSIWSKNDVFCICTNLELSLGKSRPKLTNFGWIRRPNSVEFDTWPQICHFWSNSELFSFDFEIRPRVRPGLLCTSVGHYQD